MRDVELRSEIRKVLTGLQLLSEAKATTVGRSSPSSEKPIGPPEFRGLRSVDTPSEDRSLFEHYLARFQDLARAVQATPKKEWWYLLWEAEDALKRQTVPPTEEERALMVALVPNRTDDKEREIEKALVKKVVEEYEGIDAFQVHLALRVPIGWVEYVRQQEGRDPDLGERRPAWKELDRETKLSIVADMVSTQGLTQEAAARKLGIGVRTVAEYWPRVAA